MSILIKNVQLDGTQRDIFIAANQFTQIAPDLEVTADETIDGSGKAILPSFVNTHTHAAMTLLRGYADDLKLQTWLSEHIWPIEAKMTEEDVYNGSRLACLEMIKSGTTCFNDQYWFYNATAQAVEDSGLRATLAPAIIDLHDPAKTREIKPKIEGLYRDSLRYSERLKFALGPHAIYTVSEELLRWASEFAQQNGLPIHIHISETRQEVDDCIASHSMRPVEYLSAIGLLDAEVVGAHLVWVTPSEIDLLAEKNVAASHNPVSNMKLCSGKFPYSKMLARDVEVGLGTDGASSNNNLDMGEEMKFAALHEKISTGDPTALTTEQIFRAATRTGAEIMGLDSAEIATGKLADCILVDLDNPRLTPGHNLISDMVYSADSSCIDTTICNGKILMQAGKVAGEEEIIAKARESKHRISA